MYMFSGLLRKGKHREDLLCAGEEMVPATGLAQEGL